VLGGATAVLFRVRQFPLSSYEIEKGNDYEDDDEDD